MQVVKKGKVQLQNRLVPDGPVQDWTHRIEDLQPDIDRVLQVFFCPLGSFIQLTSPSLVTSRSDVITDESLDRKK